MSLRNERSRQVAHQRGAWGGHSDVAHLYGHPKRVLIEVALRLGASCAGSCDDLDAAIKRVNEEVETLREGQLI